MEWSKVDCKGAGVLVVWPGTVMREEDLDGPEGFRSWIQTELAGGMRLDVTVVGCVKTLPNKDEEGNDVEGTGGRTDFFFFVKGPGISAFMMRRFGAGMRWWEDVYFNKQESIYPPDFLSAYPE